MTSTTRAFALLVVLASALGGCGASYLYGRTGEVTPPALPPDCRFVVLGQVPTDRPFDEIGVLAPKDIVHGSKSGSEINFKESVAEQVCAAGGEAVIAERDMFGQYVRGTVIKYKTPAP